MTELSPAQQQALQVAHDLVDMGVPIFSAPPHSATGFAYPDSWQTYRPNHIQVERWKPGWCLAMVCGVVLDVLDMDPRNGGLDGWKELEAAGAIPMSWGLSRTPSEGTHTFIARTHLAKGKPATGIDLQAGDDQGEGRGFVFLPPTVRPSKWGARIGQDVTYEWEELPRLPVAVRDTGMDNLLTMVAAAPRSGAGRKRAAVAVQDDDLAAFADLEDSTWTPDQAERVISGQLEAVRAAREGTVNGALGGAARVLGRFVAGGHLSEDVATGRLLEALEDGGVHSDSWNVANRKGWTANTVIAAAIARGMDEPWTVAEVPAAPGGKAAPGAGKNTVTPAALPEPSPVSVPAVGPRHNAPLGARELPSPGLPMDVARALVGSYPGELTWWRGDFWTYQGTHWVTVDEAEVRRWIRLATERATYLKPKTKDGVTTFDAMSWAPTIAKVREVVAALGEGVLQRVGDDDRVLALTNGILSGVGQAERVLRPHTPEVFNLTSRPFAYEEGARAPHWAKFLDEVLPDAPDDQALLQEWFGYVLSGRTDIHAILSLAGESRSGKGTILRLLTGMSGTENVAAGRLDALAAHFGLEPLIGKSLLTFGDVRWANSNAQTAIQRILEISGEDKVTIPRKNKVDWEGTLGVRIMFAGNEIPRFSDPSRAMTNRLRIIHFTQSFAGREDTGLTARLMGELPGIFNWALEGLDRLDKAGRFTESARSASLRDRVADGGDAFGAFAEEYLEAVDGAMALEDEVVEAYSEWCERTRRRKDSATADTIRSSVLDMFPGVRNDKSTRKTKRALTGGLPRKVRAFQGLRVNAVVSGYEFEDELD